MRLILASSSPRRLELLKTLHIPFSVVPSRFREAAEGLSARETALSFACGKAAEVYARMGGEDVYVLGADTVVAYEGEILGKPKDEGDARRMLHLLSGREHSVFTGVCLVGGGRTRADCAETKVRFRTLSEEEIETYIAGGSPMDKAGAYGIQDTLSPAEGYTGSYTNVIGLPMELVKEFLKENKC